MLKKLTLFLIFTTNTAYQWGMLPSCKIVKIPEGTDVIELKSKPNELSLVQISSITLPDRTPYDMIRLVNMSNPSKEFFLGFRCDWLQSQLFRNATDKPARIACYRCEGNSSSTTCPNDLFLQGDIEGATPAASASSANYATKCKPIDCSKVVSLTKCERSSRSLYEKDDRDRKLGLVETPAPKK